MVPSRFLPRLGFCFYLALLWEHSQKFNVIVNFVRLFLRLRSAVRLLKGTVPPLEAIHADKLCLFAFYARKRRRAANCFAVVMMLLMRFLHHPQSTLDIILIPLLSYENNAIYVEINAKQIKEMMNVTANINSTLTFFSVLNRSPHCLDAQHWGFMGSVMNKFSVLWFLLISLVDVFRAGRERGIHEFFIRNDLNKHLISGAFVTQFPLVSLSGGQSERKVIQSFCNIILSFRRRWTTSRMSHFGIIWYSFNASMADTRSLCAQSEKLELWGSWEYGKLSWASRNKQSNGSGCKL